MTIGRLQQLSCVEGGSWLGLVDSRYFSLTFTIRNGNLIPELMDEILKYKINIDYSITPSIFLSKGMSNKKELDFCVKIMTLQSVIVCDERYLSFWRLLFIAVLGENHNIRQSARSNPKLTTNLVYDIIKTFP